MQGDKLVVSAMRTATMVEGFVPDFAMIVATIATRKTNFVKIQLMGLRRTFSVLWESRLDVSGVNDEAEVYRTQYTLM